MGTLPGEPDRALDRRTFLRRMTRQGATALGGFALGVLVDTGWARAVRGSRPEREDYPRVVVGRVRVHHNVVGYLLLLLGLFVRPIVLLPVGLGMIVGHGLRDGLFWFLERIG
ncbi:MAG TPA: hypothetical protein VLA09_05830 [Longimicrobiales bacterium]|nr:hypothetical protein [Longimicrobiales bacterium]